MWNLIFYSRGARAQACNCKPDRFNKYNTLRLQNSGKNGEKSVLTLGLLCLPVCCTYGIQRVTKKKGPYLIVLIRN